MGGIGQAVIAAGNHQQIAGLTGLVVQGALLAAGSFDRQAVLSG